MMARREESLAEIRQYIKDDGGTALPVSADTTDADSGGLGRRGGAIGRAPCACRRAACSGRRGASRVRHWNRRFPSARAQPSLGSITLLHQDQLILNRCNTSTS